VDRAGQTVSATEFARLTGVSRERLRTWERRFGFPRPARIAHGPRRYRVADAGRVVAVRRAAEQGVPLAQAIADASRAPSTTVSPTTLASVTEAAPVSVVLVGGPEPLRVLYANAPQQALPGSVGAGQELDALPWFMGSDLERTLRTLFADQTMTLECNHPAWDGSERTERSIAYRLPVNAGEPPTVALVGFDGIEQRDTRHDVDRLEGELAQVRRHDAQHRRWIELAATLAERFQRDADDAVLSSVATTLVRGLGASDAGIAVYMAGELALGTSSRGVLGPRMVTVTGYDDLATLLHTGTSGWLTPSTASAFGISAGLHGLAVPIIVVGETLGILLLVFDEQQELGEDARQMLTVVSAGIGFTLLRDRLVASGKSGAADAAGPR
jgi:hypothetical protein